MIVPSVGYDVWLNLDGATSCGDLHGSIGHEVERAPDDKPRRPIGFRMAERDPTTTDPSWLLL